MNSKIVFIDYKDLENIFLSNQDRNLIFLEENFPECDFYILPHGLKIKSRDKEKLEEATDFIREIVSLYKKGETIKLEDLEELYNYKIGYKDSDSSDLSTEDNTSYIFTFGNKRIIPKNSKQKSYIKTILNNDIVFGIGPAGTGKTYLAVAVAVYLLKIRKVEKIVLVRPAVEAGESLGFLPGDLYEKVDPYLKPLYDALEEMLTHEVLERYKEENIIEIIPLAYMRGRTLNNAFIILDEGQNTTTMQMKMFLTRLGYNSKVVVTGDISQIDLEHKSDSGLVEAIKVLRDIPEIKFFYFDKEDVVRHPLVTKIIDAYEKYER